MPEAPRVLVEALVAPQRDKAAALAAQGDLRGAAEEWKVALTIDPKDPVALEGNKNLEERIKQAVADRWRAAGMR